ncbi:MAG0130/MAG3770 family membrane protein [Mycoplasmopsis lipofaciens]|uniref:MAG0130/MAG3770 family membrane protein n=1 Tax=Mycoplasmopsis lipofaciens TaxID=114884 RepID=UPI0004843113|nr:hypothetical protein [Mycoplasmopsis lipofaciens]
MDNLYQKFQNLNISNSKLENTLSSKLTTKNKYYFYFFEIILLLAVIIFTSLYIIFSLQNKWNLPIYWTLLIYVFLLLLVICNGIIISYIKVCNWLQKINSNQSQFIWKYKSNTFYIYLDLYSWKIIANLRNKTENKITKKEFKKITLFFVDL